jgi:CO/xanthine dehydrogenase FAD-binding subunit
MERFSYLRPRDVQEAIAFLENNDSRHYVLAGGTDLMLIIRQDKSVSGSLVDITQISEMHEITRRGDVVSIGAGATFNEILLNPIVNETAPLLCQAARLVGAAQIRNMGTIGGNVANAAACADSIPPLVCLNAEAVICTSKNEVKIPVADFVISPNKTRLPLGGLITSFDYQVPAAGARSVFLKLGRRNAMAISRLTIAALGHLNDDQLITEARFVTGSATPRICRLEAVETCLVGQKPTSHTLMNAARTAVDEMVRLAGRRWSSEYKIPALTSMAYHALSDVFLIGSSGQVLQ